MSAHWDRTDLRYYAVWHVAGHDFAGVHVGDGPVVYHSLIGFGGSMGNIRWRRCESLEEALNLYAQEAFCHSVPVMARFWGWP